ncbi:MAG TPA: peptide ligase PGM1-related protein [Anaerolineae bacterium]|nr:peptide ligase PGM1-related protein [Anaerolineae bacterium]
MFQAPLYLEPLPGSSEEIAQFHKLQRRLAPMYQHAFDDRRAPRTVVVVPSLTLDPHELAKISGIHHYEERMLCLLMLLQYPRTHIIYVTSHPLHQDIIDYYLHLLPGIPSHHAKNRLTLLTCYDSSIKPLTQKMLERPRLLQRIRDITVVPEDSHITCFNTTALERTLSVQLGLPLYACDPDLCYLGSKSDGRRIFREAGILHPDGFEDLRDQEDIVQALTDLKLKQPELRKAVVKLNESFSGEGNAVFSFMGAPKAPKQVLANWVHKELPQRLKFEAKGETWETYLQKFKSMQGIVEAWIDGDNKKSPSVQCRINPLKEVEVLSTHDQILGGPSGQIFLGCSFPAADAYRKPIQTDGHAIGQVLAKYGALGRFAVDYISVQEEDQWKHYAIEINLRKGGTTFPYLMLEFLLNGKFDIETGLYLTRNKQPRYYYASDNLQNLAYQGLTPDDLIDIMVYNNLHYHSANQQGVVFHLMGALSEFGKFGVVCIGDTPAKAYQLYKETEQTLTREMSAPRSRQID